MKPLRHPGVGDLARYDPIKEIASGTRTGGKLFFHICSSPNLKPHEAFALKFYRSRLVPGSQSGSARNLSELHAFLCPQGQVRQPIQGTRGAHDIPQHIPQPQLHAVGVYISYSRSGILPIMQTLYSPAHGGQMVLRADETKHALQTEAHHSCVSQSQRKDVLPRWHCCRQIGQLSL